MIIVYNCTIQKDPEPPPAICFDGKEANISIAELKDLATDSLILIKEDLLLSAVVISSDQQGNFFNALHLQDVFSDTGHGLKLEIELRESHLWYPPGSRQMIFLKGLSAVYKNGSLRIGRAVSSFGTVNLGRIPTNMISDHLLPSCEQPVLDRATLSQIDNLEHAQINTLIAIEEVEFAEEVLGQTFADLRQESRRCIMDCNGNQVYLISSGFSDFYSSVLPDGNGKMQGILQKDGKNFGIRIRTPDDLMFNMDRCELRNPEVTSDSIFISEIADPENRSGARFIELYNSSNSGVSLKGWSLRRYTNNSAEVSSEYPLNGSFIEAAETLVIAANDSIFRLVYGMEPDLVAGTNSVADSNGDDNLELTDPFGTLIDIFGVPGEDGSGTDHEFEDGGAFRKPDIRTGSRTYMSEQWDIYNDTGAEGTILQPLSAPEDFSPGER